MCTVCIDFRPRGVILLGCTVLGRLTNVTTVCEKFIMVMALRLFSDLWEVTIVLLVSFFHVLRSAIRDMDPDNEQLI